MYLTRTGSGKLHLQKAREKEQEVLLPGVK
jgi:hypothetical protein